MFGKTELLTKLRSKVGFFEIFNLFENEQTKNLQFQQMQETIRDLQLKVLELE